MRSLVFLAWRNLMHHQIRSFVLVLVLTIVTAIPVVATLVVGQAERALTARAATTPLIYGAQGSQIELVLNAAYFSGTPTTSIKMAEYQAMIDISKHVLVPMRLTALARNYPLVGADHEYFRVRGLKLAQGELPLKIGEAVLGAEVAERLGLAVGDEIRTDVSQAFDLAGTYPVSFTVTGILAQTGTPDDRAVLVDLRSAWIAEGIGHGHKELDPNRDSKLLLDSADDKVVANSSLPVFTSITEENRNDFHYHGDEADLPLSAILVFPRSSKSAALLKGRVADGSETRQIVQVSSVVDQLLTRVFQVKSILKNVVAVMSLATFAALGLVIVLSVKMRKREFEIANQIGATPYYAFWLVTIELAIVFAMALGLTALVSVIVYLVAPQILQGIVIGGVGV